MHRVCYVLLDCVLFASTSCEVRQGGDYLPSGQIYTPSVVATSTGPDRTMKCFVSSLIEKGTEPDFTVQTGHAEERRVAFDYLRALGANMIENQRTPVFLV